MTENDYLKERTIAEFLAWIDYVNQARQGTNESNSYRARTRLWKKYAGEAEPLGRFLRGSKIFPHSAIVKMGIESHLPDAIIEAAGVATCIEITTTDNPIAIHNRRQLNDNGFGPGETIAVSTGQELAIRKAQGNPRDYGNVVGALWLGQQELARIIDRIQRKLAKTYPTPLILIVDSCSTSLWKVEDAEIRSDLLSLKLPGPFREVWLCVYPGRVFQIG